MQDCGFCYAIPSFTLYKQCGVLLTGLSDRIFARKHDILRHHRTRHSLRASPLWALGFGGRLRSIWNWIDGVESCHWLGPSGPTPKPKWNKGEYSTEHASFYKVAWITPLSIWPPTIVSHNLVDRLWVSEYWYPWTRGYLFSNQRISRINSAFPNGGCHMWCQQRKGRDSRITMPE